VGINNYDISSIIVYPVPAKDQLYIGGKYDDLRVIDLLGKEVLHSTYIESIDITSLNDGMYLLEIIDSKKKYYQKIQVAK